MEFDGRRIIIASLFLPVSIKVELASSILVNPPTIQRRTSFISSVRTAHQTTQITEEALLDPEESIFYPTNSGNPGLYNAVSSVKELTNVLWIGTCGSSTDHFTETDELKLSQRLRLEHKCLPVFVSEAELAGHYKDFCKQILWKPFHYQLPDYPKPKSFEESAWRMYIRVNELFAQRIAKEYKPDDIIWINDYHLMLVPSMVRKLKPEATIGFFLHIPFPSSEIFRCLHVRKEILEGLLGADIIGFQIYAFMRHFVMTCNRILGLDSTPKAILMADSKVAIGCFPIGIDMNALEQKRNNKEIDQIVELLREKYKGKKVLIGRDKNDHVKGVRHKMLAFETFLKSHPEWVGKVVLIQVSLSTTEVNEAESKVSTLVSRINSQFGSIEYSPVVFLQKNISFAHYLALLTIADACVITSLRDGMNLTSHEYVFCQAVKKSPLIISEFAGTYGNFGAALRINPWDTYEVSNAIFEALTMSEEEKLYRWNALYTYITSNTGIIGLTLAQQFVRTFLSDLITSHEENVKTLSSSIPRFSFDWIKETYTCSKKRLFFLDDEGTLRTSSYDRATTIHGPDDAAAIAILTKLCEDPCNHVFLMSSSSRELLEPYCQIPNLGISAESGCFLKFPNKNWENLVAHQDLSWREEVFEIFQYYTDRTPGSAIEEKEVCLAWHYNVADAKYGEWQAAECQNHISNSLKTYPIHLLKRKSCLEVYLRNISKATAMRRILQSIRHQERRLSVVSQTDKTDALSTPDVPLGDDSCDLILCIGDDRSDEYMFEYLHKLVYKHNSKSSECGSPGSPTANGINVYTCTVGRKSSSANWHIPSKQDVIQGLQFLASL